MPKITMHGHGHRNREQKKIDANPRLQAIVLPGIGDVIYTWYKLINYVDMGYEIEMLCLDCTPQRSHQIFGCLRGMFSFKYISGFEYANYWLIQVPDLRSPPKKSLFEGAPVLHINSWPESGKSITEFMPDFKCNYGLEILTERSAKDWAKSRIDPESTNVFLYTSSYQNNLNCNNHPEPGFWAKIGIAAGEWVGKNTPLKVFLVGASYDSDLTLDTYKSIGEMGIKAELVLDQDFQNVTELLRGCDVAVAYESGFAMLADCMKVPMLWFIRCQGGSRDDHFFPYSGVVNPDSIGNWIWPFFYDQDEQEVLSELGKWAHPNNRDEAIENGTQRRSPSDG